MEDILFSCGADDLRIVHEIDNLRVLEDSPNSGILEKTQHHLLIARHLTYLGHELVKVWGKRIDRLEKMPGRAEFERLSERKKSV